VSTETWGRQLAGVISHVTEAEDDDIVITVKDHFIMPDGRITG
jgi:hypothetical protein